MENRDTSLELEEMRSQIEILKSKLNNQKIINEQQLRYSMSKKMSKIDKTMLRTVIGGCLAFIYCTWVFTWMRLSFPFIFATAILLSACLAITIYKHYSFRRINLSGGNLLEVVEQLTKIKRHYRDWWKTALPILLAWYGWWMYELLTIYNFNSYALGIYLGSAVGIIVGLVIGYKINSNIVNETNEILNQIKELQQMQ